MIVSLDGMWRIATDPENVGQKEQWWNEPCVEAKDTKVPWIIQEPFPYYHGVAWYWRSFKAPVNPDADGRYLLRFWAVDYMADVWVNGIPVGGHEGAEFPFILDVTNVIKPKADNRIAVRVLNPKHEPIDGVTLNETPHRNKALPTVSGSPLNTGGIIDSVELLVSPAVRVDDLYAYPDPNTGIIHVEATIQNFTENTIEHSLLFTAAPAFSGETLVATTIKMNLAPGKTTINTELKIDNHRLWELNDPFLYRVTARVSNLQDLSCTPHEVTVRCGFRDFRFENGYFRLNGRRIFLRSSHSGNDVPIASQIGHDPDFLRRDLLNVKVMGHNTIRFISGVPTRYQLDLCDEIGLMVYEENYASWCLSDSPNMKERYNRSFEEMIKRDRNHPSIVIWGMLNETIDNPVFWNAVDALQLVRSLDKHRLVILNSGRFDQQLQIGSMSNPGSDTWQHLMAGDGLESSPDEPADYDIQKTGDIHVYPRIPHSAETIKTLRTVPSKIEGTGWIAEYGIGSAVDLVRVTRHYEQLGKEYVEDAQYYRKRLDKFLIDWERYKLSKTFANPEEYFRQCLAKMAGQRLLGINAIRSNPKLVGYSITGTVDQALTGEGQFTTFRELKPGAVDAIFDGFYPLRWCLFAEPVNVYSGTKLRLDAVLANEDVMIPGEYPVRLQVVGPHTESILDVTAAVTIPDTQHSEPPFALPVFSEDVLIEGPSGKYQFLVNFERGGAAAGGRAEFYVHNPADMPDVDSVVTLWGDDPKIEQWLSEKCIRTRRCSKDAQTSREVILVGTEPAGGTEAFQDLAARVARGSTVIFLSPEVFRLREEYAKFDMSGTITESQLNQNVPGLSEEEQQYFKNVLWGDFTCTISELPESDYIVELAMCENWWTAENLRLFDVIINDELVLENYDMYKECGGMWKPVYPQFPTNARDGKIAIRFVDHNTGAVLYRLRLFDKTGKQVFEFSPYTRVKNANYWIPCANKGLLAAIGNDLYNRDEWAMEHPIFDGLQRGGLMDYTFYREIIPDLAFTKLDPADEPVCGTIRASLHPTDYNSGLLVGVYNFGAGRFILNTLWIRENIEDNPVAERLLRNILNYAASDITESLAELPPNFEEHLKTIGYR